MSLLTEQWRRYAAIGNEISEAGSHLKEQWNDPAGVRFQEKLQKLVGEMEELYRSYECGGKSRGEDSTC